MMQTHTPPIPPSPARLGLTGTVNSPSLPPNPTPSSKPPPPSSSSSSVSATAAAAATTSSSLLSLLPPLPRAQALLPQMAALATKLFDVSPQRSFWLASYRGNFPNFSPSAAVAASSASSSTKDLLSHFTSLQTQLFEAVAELQEILDLQDSRGKVVREVRAKDSALLAFTKKIREAQQVLDYLVDDYSGYRRDPKRSKKEQEQESNYFSSLHSALDLEEILSYAHRISYTTFAPPEHGAGLAPLRGALPPAPQENEMRASELYRFADLDVGVPKKVAVETKDRGVDVVPEMLLLPTPPREDVPAAIPPPLLPISVPPGWRKGMPIELPSELPPVPPGWKPGDPITLPPDGVMVGNKVEEQRMAGVPGVPGGQPLAPEPIQVKYVQLDINPDQDDYSSDYSTDEGSSEEDDED